MVGYVKHFKNNNNEDNKAMSFNATGKILLRKSKKNMAKSQQFKGYRNW